MEQDKKLKALMFLLYVTVINISCFSGHLLELQLFLQLPQLIQTHQILDIYHILSIKKTVLL